MATEQPALPPVDPSCPIKGLYRLFDLITEQRSNDTGKVLSYKFTSHSSCPLADRIVIAQESLQAFINALCPGACPSVSKINLKILDDLLLKPIGIYGSREGIVRFLRELGNMDLKMCVYLLLHCRRLTSNPSVLDPARSVTCLHIQGCRTDSEIRVVHYTHVHIYYGSKNICHVLARRYYLG